MSRSLSGVCGFVILLLLSAGCGGSPAGPAGALPHVRPSRNLPPAAVKLTQTLFLTYGGQIEIFKPPYAAKPHVVATQIEAPFSAVVDGKNDLLIGDWEPGTTNSLWELKPPYTSAPVAIQTFPSAVVQRLALNSKGLLFVETIGDDGTGPAISMFAPPYTGKALKTRITSVNPDSTMVFDAADNLYIAGSIAVGASTQYGVLKYAPPYNKPPAASYVGYDKIAAYGYLATARGIVFASSSCYSNHQCQASPPIDPLIELSSATLSHVREIPYQSTPSWVATGPGDLLAVVVSTASEQVSIDVMPPPYTGVHQTVINLGLEQPENVLAFDKNANLFVMRTLTDRVGVFAAGKYALVRNVGVPASLGLGTFALGN